MYQKIDLIGGSDFMKVKKFCSFLLVTYSLSGYAAFNSVESTQLSDINSESQGGRFCSCLSG